MSWSWRLGHREKGKGHFLIVLRALLPPLHFSHFNFLDHPIFSSVISNNKPNFGLEEILWGIFCPNVLLLFVLFIFY